MNLNTMDKALSDSSVTRKFDDAFKDMRDKIAAKIVSYLDVTPKIGGAPFTAEEMSDFLGATDCIGDLIHARRQHETEADVDRRHAAMHKIMDRIRHRKQQLVKENAKS